MDSLILDLNNINIHTLWDLKETLYARKLYNTEQIDINIYKFEFDDSYVHNPYRQGIQLIPEKLYYIDGEMTLEKCFTVDITRYNMFTWLNEYFPALNLFIYDEKINDCKFIFRQGLSTYRSQIQDILIDYKKICKYIDVKLNFDSLEVLVFAQLLKKFYLAEQDFTPGFYLYRKHLKNISKLYETGITFSSLSENYRVHSDTSLDEIMLRPTRFCSFFRIEFLNNIIALFSSIRNSYIPIFKILDLYQQKMEIS